MIDASHLLERGSGAGIHSERLSSCGVQYHVVYYTCMNLLHLGMQKWLNYFPNRFLKYCRKLYWYLLGTESGDLIILRTPILSMKGVLVLHSKSLASLEKWCDTGCKAIRFKRVYTNHALYDGTSITTSKLYCAGTMHWEDKVKWQNSF